MKVPLNNKEAGFTLLESLIALMLSSTILLLVSSGLTQLHKINEQVIGEAQMASTIATRIKGSRQIEWHLFLNQLEKYLEDTHLIEHTAKELIVLENDKTNQAKYGISKTGSQIFYRNNNNGYNAMLTEIQTFNLKIEGQWLILEFRFQNNEEYHGRIWVDSWKEKPEELKKNRMKKDM